MCGILLYTPQLDILAAGLKPYIINRGPDYYAEVDCGFVYAGASVLSLRSPLMPQPVRGDHGLLCYNGQLYGLGTQDTFRVHEILSTASSIASGVLALMQCEGEFAFAYIDKRTETVTFGRDRLGRRSLLYSISDRGLVVSSVGAPGFIECDAFGVYYSYDVAANCLTKHTAPTIAYPPVSRESSVSEISYSLVSAALVEAVKRRLVLPTGDAPVGILFSGGLDCTLLTALIDDHLPAANQIYLINVAFENRRTNSMYDTPDRLLARQSFEELQARSVLKRMHLVEIDVPYEEACAAKERVTRLMYPNATVMDMSIALAFYFAASNVPEGVNPRILFSGLGADELFAGYSRHASLQGDLLADELVKDFARLPHRNLGRDDRVISDRAKDVRYPFLDEQVVRCALQLPLDGKLQGTETKAVLRDFARHLNLTRVSKEKKRAIQFGARSAKMDPGSGRCRGPDALS